MNNQSNNNKNTINQPQCKSRIRKKYIQHKKYNPINGIGCDKQKRQRFSGYLRSHSKRNNSNQPIKYSNLFLSNNNLALAHKNQKSLKELMNHTKKNSYEMKNNRSLLNPKNVPMSERGNKKKIGRAHV